MIKRILLLSLLCINTSIFCMDNTSNQLSKEQITDLVSKFRQHGFIINQKTFFNNKLIIVPLAIAGTCIGSYCAFKYFTHFATRHEGQLLLEHIKSSFKTAQTEVTQTLVDLNEGSKDIQLAISELEKECDFIDSESSELNSELGTVLKKLAHNNIASNEVTSALTELPTLAQPIATLIEATILNKTEAQSIAQKAAATLDQSQQNELDLLDLLELVKKLNQSSVPSSSSVLITMPSTSN